MTQIYMFFLGSRQHDKAHVLATPSLQCTIRVSNKPDCMGKKLGKFRLDFFQYIRPQYFVEIPFGTCSTFFDMVEKTPAYLQKHQEFLTKVPPSTGSNSCEHQFFAVEVAIFMGYGFRPRRKNIMAYVDELCSFLDNTTFHQKKRNFRERLNLAEASMMNTAGKVRIIFNFNFLLVRPLVPFFKGFLFQRLICVFLK